jgi:hypothetical protein
MVRFKPDRARAQAVLPRLFECFRAGDTNSTGQCIGMLHRFGHFLTVARAVPGLAVALADELAPGKRPYLPATFRVRRAGVADRQAVGV